MSVFWHLTIVSAVFHVNFSVKMAAVAEFSLTKRGARCLKHKGYQYKLNKRGDNGRTYWRCVDKGCTGRAILSGNYDVLNTNNNHNHHPLNPLQIEVSRADDKLNTVAKELAEVNT